MGFTKMLNLIFCYQKSRKLEKCILRKRLFCFSTVKWQKIELSNFGPPIPRPAALGHGWLITQGMLLARLGQPILYTNISDFNRGVLQGHSIWVEC